MVEEKLKTLSDYLKKVSPGTPLRTVIDDLISANMGALIVFYNKELEKIIEGGFRVNCRFTPNRLFELCKMDGAIIVSSDLKKIISANVVLVPDKNIISKETGTRHQAAERTAKQVDTFAITVSERKNKTTLYYSTSKHFLESTSKLLNEVTSNLSLLEKQKEIFNELLINFDVLEMSNLVSAVDICKLIQRIEMILRISEMIKRYFTELGNVGGILNIRYKELLRGIDKIEENILRDYSILPLKRAKILLSTFNFDSLMDLEVISKLVLGLDLETNLSARGYRFMNNLELSDKEISEFVKTFGTLENLFSASKEDLANLVGKENSENIKKEIELTREQIMSGKL